MSEVAARIEIRFVHELSAEDFTAMVARARAAVADTNRVGNVEVTVDGQVGGSDVLQPGTVVERLLEGFRSVGKNGSSIHCTVDDPAEFRLASKSVEPNLAFYGVSAKRVSDGNEELVAFILGKRWEAMRHMGALNYHGSWEFWIRDPRLHTTSDDQQFTCRLELAPDGTHVYGPVFQHAARSVRANAKRGLLTAQRGFMELPARTAKGRALKLKTTSRKARR